MKKTARIKFKLSNEDLALLDKKANKANKTRSEYIRSLLANATPIPKAQIDYNYYAEKYHELGVLVEDEVRCYKATGNINHKRISELWSLLVGLSNLLKEELRGKTPQLRKVVY